MKAAAVLGALALAGTVAGAGLADPLPPVPTIPQPPSLPTPPTPPLPVKLPVSVPSVSVPKASPSTTSVQHTVSSAYSSSMPLGSVATGTTSGVTGGSGGSSYSSTGSSSAPAQARPSMTRLRSSRPWVSTTGPAAQQRTILNFRLSKRAVVVFTVREVSPSCALAGMFVGTGHRGLNRVVFRGRVHGRALPAGTYQISARARGRGTVLKVTIVIVESAPPTSTELAQARKRNVCGSAGAASTSTTSAGSAALIGSSFPGNGATGGVAGRTRSAVAGAETTASGLMPETNDDSNNTVSAAPFSPARVSKNVRNPFVIFALASAVILLGLAALPKAAVPDPRLTDVLTRHRVEVALAGAAAFAAAVVVLAVA